MARTYGKWLDFLTNDLNMSELTQRFWEMAKIFVKWRMAEVFDVRHKYVAKDLNNLNMASMCGKRLKYLRNGFTLLEMTKEFDKRL